MSGCEFDCKQERRLISIEADLKEMKKNSESKMDAADERTSSVNLRIEKFASKTEFQVNEIDKAVSEVSDKIDKNMETQRANTWMFLVTLIFTVINVLMRFIVQ